MTFSSLCHWIVQRLTATARAQRSPTDYDGFISYSHAADRRLAPGLQRVMQRLGKRFWKTKALRIFRDETDLSASPQLWSVVQAALDRSRYLVLLASPGAATSKWVKRELAFFLDTKGATAIVIALTEGQIVWDEETRDFDWSRTDALPRTLAGRFESEPLFVDLSWARKSEDFTFGSPQFIDACATLAAPLHGKSKAQVLGQEIRQRRWAAALALSVIAIVTSLALFGFLQARAANAGRIEAEQQRNAAQEQARIAENRRREALDLMQWVFNATAVMPFDSNQLNSFEGQRDFIVGLLGRLKGMQFRGRVTIEGHIGRFISVDGDNGIRPAVRGECARAGVECYRTTSEYALGLGERAAYGIRTLAESLGLESAGIHLASVSKGAEQPLHSYPPETAGEDEWNAAAQRNHRLHLVLEESPPRK